MCQTMHCVNKRSLPIWRSSTIWGLSGQEMSGRKKQDMAVLTKNDDLHVVKAGETIEKHVVVKTITQESVTLFDRDSQLEYTVLLSEEPETPAP